MGSIYDDPDFFKNLDTYKQTGTSFTKETKPAGTSTSSPRTSSSTRTSSTYEQPIPNIKDYLVPGLELQPLPEGITRPIADALRDLEIAKRGYLAQPGASVSNIPKEMLTAEEEEEDLPWWKDALNAVKDVSKDVGSAAFKGLVYTVGMPGRVIGSTAEEVGKELYQRAPESLKKALPGGVTDYKYSKPEGGSFSDWWKQILTEPFYGGREALGLETSAVRLGPAFTEEGQAELYAQYPEMQQPESHLTGSALADIGISVAFDIAFDPLTWLSLGGTALGKTAVKGAEIAAAKKVSRLAAAGKLADRGVSATLIDDLVQSEDSIAAAVKALDQANTIGDALTIKRAQNNLEYANAVNRQITNEIAIQAKVTGSGVLVAEKVRQVAYQNWAKALDDLEVAKGLNNVDDINAAEAVVQTAAKELDDATKEVFKQAGRKGTRRSYRADSRENLAETARSLRQFSERVLEDPSVVGAVRNAARLTVDTITDDVIRDIAYRGWNAIRGDIGRTLATVGESSIVVPFSKTRRFITGSDKITRGLGSVAIKAREVLASSDFINKYMIPAGRNGLFTQDELLKMRGALRSGKNLDPSKAVEYTGLLAENKRYLNEVSATTRALGTRVRAVLSNVSKEDQAVIRAGLEGSPVPVRLADKVAEIRQFLDELHNEINSLLRSNGGTGVARIDNFFPRTQTDDALEWIKDHPAQADRVSALFGVDRQFLADNFVHRELIKGANWFGHKLTGTETIDDLNRLARENPLGIKITFDFFEPDLLKGIAGYTYTHARQISTLRSAINLAARMSPGGIGASQALKTLGPEFERGVVEIAKPTPLAYGQFASDPALQAIVGNTLDNFGNAVNDFIRSGGAEFLTQRELDGIVDRVGRLLNKYSDPNQIGIQMSFVDDLGNTIRIPKTIVDTESLMASLDEMAVLLNKSTALAQQGGSPVVRRLIAQEIQLINGLLETSGDELLDAVRNIPAEAMGSFRRQFDEGWEALKVGTQTIPDVQVREGINEMFSNIKKLSDRDVAQKLESVASGLNRFYKTYTTATLGFVARNAISNAWSLLLAGVLPDNAISAIGIYEKYAATNKWRMWRGKPPITIERYVEGLKVSNVQRRIIREALASTDSSSTYWREFANEAADNYKRLTGNLPISSRFLGAEATGVLGSVVNRGPLQGVRRIAGAPVGAFRNLGAHAENVSRFILTYDGLARGMSQVEALGRTNRFLFDYSDLSTADRVLRQIIPFWYWGSRNFPLQFETLITNPRPFANLETVINNISDEQKTEELPLWMRESGAFAVKPEIPLIGGKVVGLDIGSPIRGGESPVESAINLLPAAVAYGLIQQTDPEGRVKEKGGNILGGLLPMGRALFEIFGADPSYLRGVERKWLDTPEARQNLLAAVNTLLPAPEWGVRSWNEVRTALRQLGILGPGEDFVPTSETLQLLANKLPPNTENMRPDQLERLATEKQGSSFTRYIGSPVTQLTEAQRLAELNRRLNVIRYLESQLPES